MSSNLVLITSIIYTPKIPLSYIDTRSVFTPEERFEQTKKTIQSVKEKIPNSKILIVECSNLSKEEHYYFNSNCDYFLNLIENKNVSDNIYSISKSLGEGTMTIAAIDYIKKNNIIFNNFFKITGRYWLSDNFDYIKFNNENIVVHYINNDINNCCTSLYKLHKNNIDSFYNFLKLNVGLMIKCMGYEVLFARFLNSNIHNKIINLNKIGVNGYISVSNDFIDN